MSPQIQRPRGAVLPNNGGYGEHIEVWHRLLQLSARGPEAGTTVVAAPLSGYGTSSGFGF
jgi:hypothetical protein